MKIKKSFQSGDAIVKFLDSLEIEKVYITFCKFLLEVNKWAVNLAVKGELVRFLIGISCMLQALKYWFHLQNTNNILLKETLTVSKDLHQERKFTWFSFFASLCKLINIDPSDISVGAIVLLRQKLCNKYVE